MSNFSFTVNHFYGDNHKYIDKIINECKEFLHNDSLKKFTKIFLKHYPMTKMSDAETEQLRYHIKQAYSFFINRKTEDSQIRIYNTDFTELSQGGTVIEIFGRNVPFLLDSTLAELNRLNIKVYKVIHPIFSTKRDVDGNAVDFEDGAEDKNSDSKESFLHIHMQKTHDNALLDNIISRLTEIIDYVYLGVFDWQKMIDDLHVYTAFFESTDMSAQDTERKEFLENLESQYFVFLGSAKYVLDPKTEEISFDKGSALGIIKKDPKEFLRIIQENVFSEILFDKTKRDFIEIGKINMTSPVHRDSKIDYVCIKHLDEKLNIVGIHVFIGLFTSILYYQSTTLIPIIRDKVQYVLRKGNYAKSSFSGKEIISIIETLPRDELFKIKKKELACIALEVYALLEQPALRLFVKESHCQTSLSILLFIPEVRFSSEVTEKIRNKLSNDLGKVVKLNYVQINDSRMGYYHIILDKTKTDIAADKKYYTKLEQDLDNMTSTWRNGLKHNILERLGTDEGYIIYDQFKKAFPESYKIDFRDNDFIYEDICYILESGENQTNFNISFLKCKLENKLYLKVYSYREYKLSDLISIIQNMGFKVNYEVVYEIKPVDKSPTWLHCFALEMQDKVDVTLQSFQDRVEEALAAVWEDKSPDDLLNRLVVTAQFDYRKVMVVRAITKYLCQIGIVYSKDFISEVIIKYPEILNLILTLFFAKFDPNFKNVGEDREEQCKKIRSKITKTLTLVTDSVEDRIIRLFVEVVDNMLRTNYFTKNHNSKLKDYFSFKIDSEKMPELPEPRPFREIFVYSVFFEAIHLRSAKVSRGGIRWSDRSEDFRTEILGLMKAQVAKNSIIVPMGSKGGFVVRRPEGMSNEDYYKLAVECYKKFLRGLLDITDNIVNNEIIHPANVIRRDEDDPYLVVAADKGTASFSDIANSVSKEYNYWLGDAFASGGSAGYDHKKMGITARGAWISVERHFTSIGIDSKKDDFTVAGIGDMSGDVFGNGLLLSEHIKLLAAFNHLHIFIDPNPDAAKSFKERKRLFELPKSTWLDYNPKILSDGAKIFSKFDKILELTDEIQKLFGLQTNIITPTELMKLILQMKVDLFWNGGIGTYVKATSETNLQVGDKSNDAVRINGNELRCKVFAEGGNLGLTQSGRIEFALNGGHINTDAIDNSAGVDCSDHEVNIKIALNKAMENKKITLEERDLLLGKMTNRVAELVLQDNYLQNLALTISEHQSYGNLGNYDRLIRIFEEKNIINRKLENLPTEGEIASRMSNKTGLTKPELSTLLAFSKNSIFNELINSKLPDDEYFFAELINYFPADMQEKFAEEIASHPLRREIIATSVTNNMINRIACFYLHLNSEDTGIKIGDIAMAYTITRDVFDMQEIWEDISKLDGKISVEVQVDLFIQAMRFVMRGTSWLLSNSNLINNTIRDNIKYFQPAVLELKNEIKKIISGSLKLSYQAKHKFYVENFVPGELASKISLLNSLSSSFDIISIANELKLSALKIAEIYFDLGKRLDFEWFREALNKVDPQNIWQRLSIRVYKEELSKSHRMLARHIILNYGVSDGAIDNWFANSAERINRYMKLIDEIKKQESFEKAMIALVLKRIDELIVN